MEEQEKIEIAEELTAEEEKGTASIEQIQEQRDNEFAEVLKELQKRYHKKNIDYADGFMIANENADEAFNELKPIFEVLTITLKHRERLFNKEKYLKKLKDLAVVAVENVMWIENNIK